MEDLKTTEKMFRFLKSEGCDADEIYFLFSETNLYFSDRNMNKYIWGDDLIREKATQYPLMRRAKVFNFR
jgi:hypothetical protein